MKFIRRIFGRPSRQAGTSRFERYYGGVIRSGSGFPTADEARRDLHTHDRVTLPFGWPH